MTKGEVTAALMELPRDERREVLAIGLASLEPTDDRLADRVAGWFDGPGVEMTDERWTQLTSRRFADLDLDRPLGAAVPPEHSGKTLRELLATRR